MANTSHRQVTGLSLLYYGVALASGVAYLLLQFFAPATNILYNFSPDLLLFLKLSITLPYIITWIFAAYGLLMLHQFIDQAKTEEIVMIELLQAIRKGLLCIGLGTILVALFSAVKAYFATNIQLTPILTIISNYLYVVPSLVGFSLIYCGVRKLIVSQKLTAHGRASYLLNTLIVLGISGFYIFLIYTNPTRQISPNPLIPATYYLSDTITVLTVIIPIIITWWLGFFAAFTISDLVPYITRTSLLKGISHLLYGLWFIIFSSIIIQALISLGNTRLAGLGLGALLFVIYLFVILQASGYFMIALSSKTLIKSLLETKSVNSL